MIAQVVASLIRPAWRATLASAPAATAAALALCLGAAAAPAIAQNTGPVPGETAANAQQEGALQEVTVTARFRSENVQSTPLAITAVTADTLAARGQTDVTQLAQFVPNAVISPLGAGWGSTIAATIRGVGLSDNSLSFEPGVPIYVDGVYLGRPQGAILDLLDLDRVEVLRGPQGTLFGKNAIGGIVSLISKQPTGDGHGYAEADFGSFNKRYFRGTWDVPVIPDNLFARVSFSSKRHDGYVDVLDYQCVNGAGSLGAGGTGIPGVQAPIKLGSAVSPTDTRGCVVDHQGGEDVQSARVALRYVGTEKLDVTLTGDYTIQNDDGAPDQYTMMDPTNPLVAAWNGIVGTPVFGVNWDQRFLPKSNYTNYDAYSDPITGHVFPNVDDLTEYGIANTINYTVAPDVTLKAITAYRRFSNSFGRNSSGSPLPINYTWDTSNHHQWSEEITLTGTAFQKLDWTVGGFYYDGTDSNQGFSSLFYLVPFLADNSFNDYDIQTTRDYAGFLHGVYHFTDQLSLEVGVRYTSDKKHAVIFRQAYNGTITIPHAPVDVSATRTNPKVALSYQFTPDLLGYIQYSTGFRGGGFGPRPGDAYQVRSFNPEDLKTGEIGVKSEWFNHTLRFNGDFYYSRYTNLQQGFNTTDPLGNPWFSTVNVGASRILGIEAELLAEPVTGLQLQGSFGLTDYKVTDAGGPIDTTPGTANFGQSAFGVCIVHANGDNCTPQRVPKYTASGSAQYTWSVPNGSAITLRGDTTWQSAVYFTDLTYTAVPGQGAYALYNARLTWDSPNKDWSVAAYGQNLANKFYWNGKLTLQVLGFEEGNPGMPRTWGIELKRSF